MAAFLLGSGPALAESSLLYTEPRTGSADFGIDGFELYNRGYYWWKIARESGEFNSSSRMGISYAVPEILPLLGLPMPDRQNEGTPDFDGAALDGGWVYFTKLLEGSPGLYRKPANAGVQEGIQYLHAAVPQGLSALGAVAVQDGYVYYVPQYLNGSMTIVRVPVDASGAVGSPEQKSSAVIAGSQKTRLIRFYRRAGKTWGLVLKTGGELLRFGPLEQAGPVPCTLLASGIGDVFIRPEARDPFHLPTDSIYAATAATITPGRLFLIDPDTTVGVDVYTAPGGDPVTWIESATGDENFLFVSVGTGVPGQANAARQILRNYLPAQLTSFDPALETGGWVTMEAGQASIMRSDRKWLYFTRGNEIRRISTTARPIVLDVGVFGLEVVQVSQNLANSIPLVADKPAIARGYVWLTANSQFITRPNRHPEATLYVYHDGTLVGEIAPFRYPDVHLEDTNTPARLAEYRADTSRNYLFEVPGSLIQPGVMSFTLEVNSRRTLLETGKPNVWANNEAVIPFMRAESRARPTLIFTPIANAGAPTYTLATDPAGFGSILDRAVAMLPVSGFNYRQSSLVIRNADQPWSFTPPDESDAALAALHAADIRSSGDDVHRVGMVHPGIPTYSNGRKVFNGLGEIGDHNLLARMSTTSRGITWNSPLGGQTLAHELGHNYGRQHVLQLTNCGGSIPLNPEAAYPYPGCQFGPDPNTLIAAVFGYDWITDTAIDGTQSGDLMSYSDANWASDYTYSAILNAIPSPSAAASPFRLGLPGEEILFLTGLVNPETGQVELQLAHHSSAQLYNASRILKSLNEAQAPQGHGFTIQQIDGQGTILSEANLVVSRTGDSGPGVLDSFAQFVEANASTREIRVQQRGHVVASRSVSASAPRLIVEPPQVDQSAGLLHCSWNATDDDGDALVFAVQYSNDGGDTWEMARLETPQTSVALELKSLPGGANAKLRVIANDGYHTTVQTTGPFEVPRRPPAITLNGLETGAQVPYGTLLRISARALDPDDGLLPPPSITWSLAGPETLTSDGDTLRLEILPPGAYRLWASAIDSDGQSGQAEVSFEVLPFSIPELPDAPDLDGVPDEAVWDSALVIRWRDGLGKAVNARVFRSAGYVYVAFNDLAYSVSHAIGGLYPPAKAGLYLDVGGADQTSPGTNVSGFFVDENGVPSQTQGDGTALVNRPTPGTTFQAVVNQSEFAWSAEMRIGAGLVGESGQTLRLALSTTSPNGAGTHPAAWPSDATPEMPGTWTSVLAAGPAPVATNRPPRACAGGDQFLEASSSRTAFLDGSGSVDPEGAPLTYQWRQISGPTVELAHATSPMAQFQVEPGPSEQVWSFTLTVSDGELVSPPVQVSVRLQPKPTSPSTEKSRPEITRLPDGEIEGRFPAAGLYGAGESPKVGQRYQIEQSTDLETWTPYLQTSPDFLGRIVFRDRTSGDAHRFYRALPADPEQALDPGHLLRFGSPGSMVVMTNASVGNYFPLSVSFWIRTTQTDAGETGLISKFTQSLGVGWSVFLSQGRVRAWYLGRNGIGQVQRPGIDGGFVADGKWHQIAFVVDTSGGTLYVDATATGVRNWTGRPVSTSGTNPIQIGRFMNDAQSVVGDIDEVTLWSSALNIYRIQSLSLHGPLGTEPDLQGWWKLDDGTGDTASDSSGKGRDGMLMNGPTWEESDAPITR